MGESNISRPSFKLNAMKQKPALRSIISTREEQHDNTGIHANPWCSDQSTQMASWQLAYCWIIHSLHQAGKKSSMGPGDSAFSPLCPCWCCQTTADKNVTSVKFPHFLIFFFSTNWVAVLIWRVFSNIWQQILTTGILTNFYGTFSKGELSLLLVSTVYFRLDCYP